MLLIGKGYLQELRHTMKKIPLPSVIKTCKLIIEITKITKNGIGKPTKHLVIGF